MLELIQNWSIEIIVIAICLFIYSIVRINNYRRKERIKSIIRKIEAQQLLYEYSQKDIIEDCNSCKICYYCEGTGFIGCSCVPCEYCNRGSNE